MAWYLKRSRVVDDGCLELFEALFAAVAGLVAYIWFYELEHSGLLGGIIAGAMIINLVVAGVAGVALPLMLERMRIDPAVASGVFVTTVTDVVGFFAFLGLASLVLL